MAFEKTKDIDEKAPFEQLHPSYKLIPKFFDSPHQSGLHQILRMEALGIELRAKAKELLNFEELEELWETLEEHVTETTRNNQMLIDLGSYLNMISVLGVKFREFINVRLFFDLMHESEFEERLEIVSIYNHTIRRIRLARARICLCYYDQFGMGYLRESDLESFIMDMRILWGQPLLEKFYVCAVVKMVFFFLDSMHTQRVRISDIESSGMLWKIIELNGKDGEKHSFSQTAILGVYEEFLRLDKDHNGLLSKTEMSDFGSGLLTKRFLDRAFEKCRTFGGEIDYKTFVEFFLALEYRHTSAGLRYIFRILDINQQGYLTAETLFLYFYTETQEGYHSQYNFADIKNKIFDMVKPRDPLKITLMDLINCREGNTVVSLIIEFQKFVANKKPDSEANIKNPNSNWQPQRRDTLAATTLSQI